MAMLNIFRTPRHQRYNYKPRFYDPQKEEVNERVRQIEAIKDGDVEEIKNRITGGFRQGSYGTGASTYRNQQVFRSNMILLAVIVGLCFFTYIFLSLYLPEIAAAVESNAFKGPQE